ncbi:MAG: class I SAM-dependent methyltransferase [Peptostreptococcaceae bacterium]
MNNLINNVGQVNKIFLKSFVNEGDIVIDATVGNGHDTVFLNSLIKKSGKIYAFDIQEDAINSTRKLLIENNINNVELINNGHENIDKYVFDKISCAVFNLGYLPTGDKTIVTKSETTIAAIKSCLELLNNNGIISISIYSGHEGGEIEKSLVYEFVKSLDQKKFNVLSNTFLNQKNTPPELILIEKKITK